MIQTLSPEEARNAWDCPVARVMAHPGNGGKCKGETCAAWRFLPLSASDPAFQSAVQREILLMEKEKGDRVSSPSARAVKRKAAVARVMSDPCAYSIPGHHERGYCGLGGQP